MLLALDRLGHTRLNPLCTQPLLEGLARAELERLALIEPEVSPSDHGYGLALLGTLPPAAATLAKRLYRLHQRTPWAARHRSRLWQPLLRRCHPHRTVYHSPYLGIPPELRHQLPGPVLVTLHDMLPVLQPTLFTAETRRQFARLLASLRPDDHVICVSESTRRDFLAHTTVISPHHVHVTPLAASPTLQPLRDPRQAAALRERLGLCPDDRVILSLSTLEPRKNLLTLLTAFERLHGTWSGRPLRLVLAGSEGWKIQPLLERLPLSPAREAILLTGHVADTDLPALFSLSELFVYPSLYEGFGLPPLEAMQCGLPVIAGHSSSLPEVVGVAGLLVDPRSSAALSEAIASVLASEPLRADLRQRGLIQAQRFSWDRTAALTLSIYEQALLGATAASP